MAGQFFGQATLLQRKPSPETMMTTASIVTTAPVVLPPPPNFADVKFTTIGQQPELLRRFSAPDPDHQYQDLPSPSQSETPDLEDQLLADDPPRPRSRLTLFQALAGDTVMSDAADEMAIDGAPGNTASKEQLRRSVIPSPHQNWAPIYSALSVSFTHDSQDDSNSLQLTYPASRSGTPAPSNSASAMQQDPTPKSHSSQLKLPTPPPHSKSPTPQPIRRSLTPSRPFRPEEHAEPESDGEGDSPSYTALRALHVRLLGSFHALKPSNNNRALLLAQSAASQSALSLDKAQAAYALALQSLTCAQVSVAAAQESLSAAGDAGRQAAAAAAAVQRTNKNSADGGGGGEDEGQGHWEQEGNVDIMREDLRAFGEWISEKEAEKAAKRRERERKEVEEKNRRLLEVVMNGAAIVPHRSARGEAESELEAGIEYGRGDDIDVFVDQHRPPAKYRRIDAHRDAQRTAEMEADLARRAWEVNHSTSAKTSPREPQGETDTAHQAEEVHREELPGHQVREQADICQAAGTTDEAHGVGACQNGEFMMNDGSDAGRSEPPQQDDKSLEQASVANPDTETDAIAVATEAEIAERLRELYAQKLEVARFQIQQRELAQQKEAQAQPRWVANHDAHIPTPETQRDPGRKTIAASVFGEHSASEAASSTGLAAEAEAEVKKVQDALEQRRKIAREIKEVAEKVAEAQQQEAYLRAEQEKKKQLVMAEKQRASAQAAAEILTERAKEAELMSLSNSANASPLARDAGLPVERAPTPAPRTTALSTVTTPGTSVFLGPVTGGAGAYSGNPVAKKTLISKAKLTSGGVRLGATTTDEPAPTTTNLPPSATLARSTAVWSGDKPSSSGDFGTPQLSKPSPVVGIFSTVQQAKASSDSPSTISVGVDVNTTRQALSLPPIEHLSATPITRVTAFTHAGARSGASSSSSSSITSTALDPAPVSVYRQTPDAGNIPIVSRRKSGEVNQETQAQNLRFVTDVNGVGRDIDGKCAITPAVPNAILVKVEMSPVVVAKKAGSKPALITKKELSRERPSQGTKAGAMGQVQNSKTGGAQPLLPRSIALPSPPVPSSSAPALGGGITPIPRRKLPGLKATQENLPVITTTGLKPHSTAYRSALPIDNTVSLSHSSSASNNGVNSTTSRIPASFGNEPYQYGSSMAPTIAETGWDRPTLVRAITPVRNYSDHHSFSPTGTTSATVRATTPLRSPTAPTAVTGKRKSRDGIWGDTVQNMKKGRRHSVERNFYHCSPASPGRRAALESRIEPRQEARESYQSYHGDSGYTSEHRTDEYAHPVRSEHQADEARPGLLSRFSDAEPASVPASRHHQSGKPYTGPPRGPSRGRGGRGRGRPLALEQRISSQPALAHRMEIQPPSYDYTS